MSIDNERPAVAAGDGLAIPTDNHPIRHSPETESAEHRYEPAIESNLPPDFTKVMGSTAMTPPSGNHDLDTPLSDTELAGFEDLMQKYWQRVARYAGAVLKNAISGEDAAQETFMRALRHYRRIDFNRDPFPWLSHVARNVALDMRRSRQHDTYMSLSAATTANQDNAEDIWHTTATEATDYLAGNEEDSGTLHPTLRASLLEKLPSHSRALPPDEQMHLLDNYVVRNCSVAEYVALHHEQFGDRYGNTPIVPGTVKSRSHNLLARLSEHADEIRLYTPDS